VYLRRSALSPAGHGWAVGIDSDPVRGQDVAVIYNGEHAVTGGEEL